MATVKSTNITNIEAAPMVPMDGKVGHVIAHIDTIALATTNVDNADDLILIGAVPSNAKILSVITYNDDLDGGAGLVSDFGLYYGINNVVNGVKKSSGDVLDADFFVSGSSALRNADTSGLAEYRFTNAGDINGIGQEVWQLGGLSEDCGGLIYLGVDITTAAATPQAGDLTVKIEYMI